MTWPGRAGSPRDFLRPHIVFLYICFLYIAFPSNHFNADGLHYNLIAYLSTVRPSALFRDHSVPAHFLWHLMSLGLLRVFRPASPEQSLYILRAANIALALGSIFVFMRLVRSLAGESTAAWATIALAFSHACLREFLSVEVYSLSALMLMILMWYVHEATLAGTSTPRTGQALAMGMLTGLAVAAHIANLLLVVPVAVVLCAGGVRKGLRPAGVYALSVASMLGAMILGMSALASSEPTAALRSLFGYWSARNVYLSTDLPGNLQVALRTTLESVLGRFGPWMLVPIAAYGIFAARHWRLLRGRVWLLFLASWIAVFGALVSQWDPSNLEHKVALIPMVLLLVVSIHALTRDRLPRAFRTGAIVLAGVLILVGIVEGILPYTDAHTDPLYRLSEEIHEQSQAPEVLLVGLVSERRGNAVVLSSMTFFDQRVLLMSPTDPGYDERIAQRARDGGDILLMVDGHPRRQLPPVGRLR
ncbi:MAG TPA: DUF2723 domain-containing protein [Patescibacteria group bacterium]|nr:DUF2723 domain-containing protein [Patescibacteria group bacterium]